VGERPRALEELGLSAGAVTVGLPVYNGAESLDRALGSLCAQTFADLSILVSDNASTDETPRIIASWAARDVRVRVHRQPRNIGAKANFRWVLDAADTPWFAYAAHDDAWSPNYVEALHRVITARPGLVMAVPQVVSFLDSPHRPAKVRRYPARLDRLAGAARLRLALRRSRPSWFYGLFHRQTLLGAVQQASALEQVWGEDVLTILHVLLAGGVTGSNEAIFYNRRGRPTSYLRYAPKTARERAAHYRKFMRLALAALAATPLSPFARARALPALWHFARVIDKSRSILWAALREA
jgi:glycosyltransferase involved in cell wall biosynthesis